jgi:hypothetical protein
MRLLNFVPGARWVTCFNKPVKSVFGRKVEERKSRNEHPLSRLSPAVTSSAPDHQNPKSTPVGAAEATRSDATTT